MSGREALAHSLERAPAELKESMAQLTRSVQEGRCPADDFADQVVAHGIASAMSQLVKGEL